MKNETFKVELREGHMKKGGGGMSGGDCLRTIQDEEWQRTQEGGSNKQGGWKKGEGKEEVDKKGRLKACEKVEGFLRVWQRIGLR